MARRIRLGLAVIATLAAVVARGTAEIPQSPPALRANATLQIPYSEARPILEWLGPNIPPELARLTPVDRQRRWPDWVSQHDVDIRARLKAGDEDSIVNLLLFGTSFTKLPRALNDSSKLGGAQRGAEIVRGRIADMVAGAASPGANERLLFVRDVVKRRGIDPTTAAGKEQVRLYLRDIMRRMFGEFDNYIRTIESAKSQRDSTVELMARSSLFRTRGLSSDTSIRPDFAVDQALMTLASNGLLAAGSVRRVAVIGPGLDFADKAEGFDFYPQQTTQPFAVIDALRRLELAHAEGVRITTLDLNPRVNRHLETIRQRAGMGRDNVLVLTHDRAATWRPDLTRFWNHFGDTIGKETTAPSPPPGVQTDARAVGLRPDVVLSIEPQDVDVVVERLSRSAGDDRFDLVIATNVFVYYNAFEQALALANIAAMLRPGGFLLSNNALPEPPMIPVHSAGHGTVQYTDANDDNDSVFWYQRR